MSNNTGPRNPYVLADAEKFNGENWTSWKLTIVTAAKARGVNGYLDGTIINPSIALVANAATTVTPTPIIPPPLPTAWFSIQPSADEWIQRNADASSLIVNNVKNAIGLGVNVRGTAAEAWKSLTEIYDVVNPNQFINIMRELRTLTYDDNGDILNHIMQLRTLWSDANDMGANIEDAEFHTIVLASLPASWEVLVSGLHSATSSAVAIRAITQHNATRMRNRTTANPAGVTIQSLMAEIQALKASALQAGGGGGNRPRSIIICTNANCKRRGHTIENCFWPGGGKEGEFPDWFKKKGGGGGGGGSNSHGPVVPNANVATAEDRHYVLSAMASIGAMVLASNPIITTYADSGATDHFFKDRDSFSTYETFTVPRLGQSANEKTKFSIVGTGKVIKSVVLNGVKSTITFDNALHAPTIHSNLVSISRFDKAGAHTLFSTGKVTFFDKDLRPFLEGRGHDGMYLLDGLNEIISMSARSHEKPVSLEMWHRRWGHVGISGIKEIMQKKLVDGLDVTGTDVVGQCEPCLYGKQVRRPFDEIVIHESKLLQRVHGDVWGPARVRSGGGAYYMFFLVDGYSGYRSAAFLTHKSGAELLDAFKTYHVMAERQTGEKLKKFRTDGAKEFGEGVFAKYLRDNGIIHETTAPYSSSQNGSAERGIRTAVEGIRCMLEDSGLPKSLWAEAGRTSIYLRNLVPSARNPGHIPAEVWTGERQDVSHLRPFGCVAYAKLATKELGISKLDSRSVKCVLVGYFGRGAYRLYNTSTGRITKARDVIFDEGIGRRTLPAVGEIDEYSDLFTIPAEPPTSPPLLITKLETPTTDLIAPDPITRRATRLIIPAIPTRRSERIASDTYTPRAFSLANLGEFLAEFDSEHTAAITIAPDAKIPQSYREAIKRPDLWKEPMEVEMQLMKDKGVWRLVDRPTGVNIIKNRWTYANKYDAEGNINRRKARLVAKGFTQVEGVDYHETYASVVRLESLRMSMAISCELKLKTWQIDFVSAYLNSVMKELVYMEQPEGFVEAGKEGMVCILDFALYGTMQGGHEWWEELDTSYDALGYYRSRADPCVRTREVNGELTMTSTYNDDVVGASTTDEGAQKAKNELASCYEIKDLGECNLILGITIEHDTDAGTISLSMRPFYERALERYGLTDCNPRHTPLPVGIELTSSQCPSTDDERAYMADKPYREILGTIMWAQVATRPDLSFAVNLLSRFQANPGKAHWLAILHVMGYIKATVDYKITYTRGTKDGLKPIGYVDADYGGDLDTRRSTSGYVFIMAGGPTSWNSKRQATVALSTTEAELMGLTRGAQQAVWTYSHMDECGQPQEGPALILCDNQSAMALTKNTGHHARVKHIDIRHHYIRELVHDKKIEVKHVPTTENLADILTKPLPRATHEKFVRALGLMRDDIESGGVLV